MEQFPSSPSSHDSIPNQAPTIEEKKSVSQEQAGAEQEPSTQIGQREVMDALRTNGMEHPETNALVMQWTMEQEQQVERANTSEAQIIFDISRADLYVAMGDIDGALELLNEAFMQIHQESKIGLFDLVTEKIDAIENLK